MNKIAQKIAIIGCAGSGKTTLAQQVAVITKLPLIYLDKYYWKPGWQRPDIAEFTATHQQLCNQDAWIIDGIYTATLPYRLEKADCIVFLDMPRWICLWRVFKRYLAYCGTTHDSSPEDCPERLSFEFFAWIWNFQKKGRPAIYSMLEAHASKKRIYILKSEIDIQNCLRNMAVQKGSL